MDTSTPFKIALCTLMLITGLYIGYTTGYQAGYNTGWFMGEADGFINAKFFEFADYEKGFELGTLKTIAYYEKVPYDLSSEEIDYFARQSRLMKHVMNETPLPVPESTVWNHALNSSERMAIYEGGT